jgi:hypothetical protein
MNVSVLINAQLDGTGFSQLTVSLLITRSICYNKINWLALPMPLLTIYLFFKKYKR